MPLTRIYKNSAIYFLGNHVSLVYSLLVLLVLTRYLDTNEYGALTIIRMVSLTTSQIVLATVAAPMFRFYVEYERDPELRRRFVSSTLAFVLALAVCTLALLSVDGDRVLAFLFPGLGVPFFPFFFVSLVALVIALPYELAKNLAFVQERPGLFLVLDAWRFGSQLLFLLVFLAGINASLLGVVYADLASAVTLVFVAAYVLRDELTSRLSWPAFRPALLYSLPLLPYAALQIVVDQLDRFVLQKYVPLSSVGVYAIGRRLGSLPNSALSSLVSGYSPRILRLYAEKGEGPTRDALRQLAVENVVLLGLIAAGVALFSKEAVWLLTGASYHGAYVLVAPIAVGYLARAIALFGENIYFWTMHTQYVLHTQLASAAVLAAGLVLLVPRAGTMGAALAVLLYYVAMAVIQHLCARQFLRVDYRWGRMLWVVAVASFLAFGCVIAFAGGPSVLELFVKVLAWGAFGVLGLRTLGIPLTAWRRLLNRRAGVLVAR